MTSVNVEQHALLRSQLSN